MTDTTQDTELTPRDREMMRRGYAKRMMDCEHNPCTPSGARQIAEYAIPEPPAHTYGPEVKWSDLLLPLQRRSDGAWGWWYNGRWYTGGTTDAHVRALAACVPLSDAECTALYHSALGGRFDRIRAAFVRVMRGEVAHG